MLDTNDDKKRLSSRCFLKSFLLPDDARSSVFATANIGLVIAMIAEAALYAFLTFVCRFDVPPVLNKKQA